MSDFDKKLEDVAQRAADFVACGGCYDCNGCQVDYSGKREAFILAALREACAMQREADAAVCEDERVDADATGEETDIAYNLACEDCAAAIRGAE